MRDDDVRSSCFASLDVLCADSGRTFRTRKVWLKASTFADDGSRSCPRRKAFTELPRRAVPQRCRSRRPGNRRMATPRPKPDIATPTDPDQSTSPTTVRFGRHSRSPFRSSISLQPDLTTTSRSTPASSQRTTRSDDGSSCRRGRWSARSTSSSPSSSRIHSSGSMCFEKPVLASIRHGSVRESCQRTATGARFAVSVSRAFSTPRTSSATETSKAIQRSATASASARSITEPTIRTSSG